VTPASDDARRGVAVEIEAEAWSAALPHAEALVQEAAAGALVSAQDDGAVTILLTDDETVRDLNLRFRATDAPTNVLAFPAASNPESALGDIALAFGVCEREALVQGKFLADHLRHLVIHGVLHLLGYDHQTDAEAEVMEARERELLAGLGVSDPYAQDHGVSDNPRDDPDVAIYADRHGR
jgi:probable rRNA maturation factor